MWFVQQRAERRAELRSEVGTAVAQAGSFRKQFHFREARELLEQARQRLQPAGPDDLRRQVDQARADLALVVNLDTARLRAATPVEGRLESVGAEALYEEAFAKAGLSRRGDNSEAVAARVRNSAVRVEIVAALDDWASITQDQSRRAWLLAVARGADPDPLRDRLRQPNLWQDGPALDNARPGSGGGSVVPAVIDRSGPGLPKEHGEAVSLLSAAQARYPQDFWLNYELGWALYGARQNERGAGFFRAALAFRPKASLAHNAIGLILGDYGPAGRGHQPLPRIHPPRSRKPRLYPTTTSGIALQAKGQMDEAISHYQESIRLEPKASATPHNNLGNVLRANGRVDEAISHYQESIRLDPKMAAAHNNLGIALGEKGRLDEAISHFQELHSSSTRKWLLPIPTSGMLRSRRARLDEAITYYQECHPDRPQPDSFTYSTLYL